MPTLFKLVFILAVMATVVYGSMLGLATFVEPTQTQMTIRLPVASVVN